MSEATLISFITLSLVVCLAPGPAMLFVILQGLSKNRKNVAAGIAGLVAANFIWIFFSAFGIGAFIQSSRDFFQLLKMCGAVYLIYLGISELLHRGKAKQIQKTGKSMTLRAVFLKGVLTSITNPKALLFYMAFLPQFISGHMAYHYEILVLGGCYLLVIILVMSFYGIMASQIASRLDNAFFNGLLAKTMGICFVGFGISLLKYEQS